MKIKHLNEGSSMKFRLLKESVTNESSENQPLARISVDGIFHINLTARDVAEMLARKGFETPIFFDIEPIDEDDDKFT